MAQWSFRLVPCHPYRDLLKDLDDGIRALRASKFTSFQKGVEILEGVGFRVNDHRRAAWDSHHSCTLNWKPRPAIDRCLRFKTKDLRSLLLGLVEWRDLAQRWLDGAGHPFASVGSFPLVSDADQTRAHYLQEELSRVSRDLLVEVVQDSRRKGRIVEPGADLVRRKLFEALDGCLEPDQVVAQAQGAGRILDEAEAWTTFLQAVIHQLRAEVAELVAGAHAP